jgi:hypothetical protein
MVAFDEVSCRVCKPNAFQDGANGDLVAYKTTISSQQANTQT